LLAVPFGWQRLGEIVQRGYKPAQLSRSGAVVAAHFALFYVMTHGYGAMPDYSAQLTPVDRWAVAAYIRALQLSRRQRWRMCLRACRCAA